MRLNQLWTRHCWMMSWWCADDDDECVDRVIYSSNLCQHIHSLHNKNMKIVLIRLHPQTWRVFKNISPIKSFTYNVSFRGGRKIFSLSVCLEGLDILLLLFLYLYLNIDTWEVRCNIIFNHISLTILQKYLIFQI